MFRKIIFFCAGIFVFAALFGDNDPTNEPAHKSSDGISSRAMPSIKQSQNSTLLVEPEKNASLLTSASLSEIDKAGRLSVDPQKAQTLLSKTPDYRFVTGNRVNFRKGPSTKNEVLGQLSKGAKTKFLGTQNDWIHIELTDGSNRSGWMAATYLSSTPTDTATTKVLVNAPQKAPPKRSIGAPTSRDITQARKAIIRQSIASYSGSCPCPYNRDRAGRRCGKRSAWSRPGGYSPACYDSDITEARLATHFARERGKRN